MRINFMYKHIIGVKRCRIHNDRAAKLVYTYVNSRTMKFVRERQRELAHAEAKELPIFQLPELIFNPSLDQDPQVYSSLGHDALTNVGLDAFVATMFMNSMTS